MMSSLCLEVPSVTKKTATPPPVGRSSKQPAAPASPTPNYRSETAAEKAPNSDATAEESGGNTDPSTPPARVLPEHVLSSEENNHNNSDSACSSFSATHAVVNMGSTSDATALSVPATNEVPPRSKVQAPKKTLGKRARVPADSSASATKAAAVPAKKKRVRSNALMRSAPLATAAATPGSLAGNSEFMYVILPSFLTKTPDSNRNRNFTATIFIIQLGPDGPQFHAHESVLKRSPKLAEEIDKAKANKRATKQNTLPLIAHDAIAFEQMLQFLYKDKFLMSKTKHTPLARLGEFKELMSLAKHYVLPGLQKQIVKLFSSSKIQAKVPPSAFFDWAEDMWHEELDHDSGPFKVYLTKVAPTLVKGADEATKKEILRMVNQGGGFAEQLFIAVSTVSLLCLNVFGLQADCIRRWRCKKPWSQ